MPEYKVIHFLPKMKSNMFSTEGASIESQVQDAINREAQGGWAFVSYQTAHAIVKPGCLAGLIGKKEEVLSYDIIIFSK